MLIGQDSEQSIPNAPSREVCTEVLGKAVKALEHLDPGNRIIERCHKYLQRLIAAINTTLGELRLARTLTLQDIFHANNAAFTASAENVPHWQGHMLPLFNVNGRYMSSDTMPLPAFLDGNSMPEKNVGDLMTGVDFDFLNFYFPAPSTMASTFAPGM